MARAIRGHRETWVAALLILLIAQATASATTFALLDEQGLTRQAALVVTGRVLRADAKPDAASGGVVTEVVIEPDAVVAGTAPAGVIRLREPGGELANRSERVFGRAEYHAGERVLVFASRAADGSLRTSSLAMGKYAINGEGPRATATRDLGIGVLLLDPRSARIVENPAPQSFALDALLESVRATVAGRPATAAPVISALIERDIIEEPAAPFTYLGSPSRWFEPDWGMPVAYGIDATGDAALGAAASQTAIMNALDAWTVPTTRLELVSDGPIAPAPFSGCPSANQIVFNDPYEEVADPVSCGGVLAVGGYCSSGETTVVDDTVFHRITVGKVVINNGWGGCPGWNACNLAEVATHELGHTLGFDHSQDLDATMAAFAHFDGRCAGLRSDDVAALNATYPMPLHDAVAIPVAPIQLAVSAQRPTVTKRVTLKVQNGDTSGGSDHIRLTVDDGDCPAGSAGIPDFGTIAADEQDTVWLDPGQRANAKVTIAASAEAFQTPDGRTPRRCTLIVRAQSLVFDNADPVPGNDSYPLELNIVDRGDIGRSAAPGVHQSFIKSLAPVKVRIPRGASRIVQALKVQVGNGDYPETPGHTVTINPQPGDCPAGAVGMVTFAASAQANEIMVRGARRVSGTLTLTLDAAQFTTSKKSSPARCTASLIASGPGGDTDPTNDRTQVIIDVIDDNDL